MNPDEKLKNSAGNNFFTEWLEKLQQESWQLELLISGFVLFGLAQSYDYIIDLANEFQKLSIEGNAGGVVFVFLFALMYFWRIFFINLLIHVILRGLWIGTIGLRYVSGDIDFDGLKYSKPITDYLKRKIVSYDNYIEKLEKISSLVFAYTFLLFFIFLSFVIFFAEIILFQELIGFLEDKFTFINENIWQVILLIGFFFLIIPAIFVFIDFITLGGLKRIKGGVFPKIYLFVYRIYSKLTFSFMYRPLLYNFIDDKFTRRIFLFSIPYFLAVTVLYDGLSSNTYAFMPSMNITTSDMYINPRYYDDARDLEKLNKSGLDKIYDIQLISLETETVRGRYLNFFVRIYDQFDGKYLRHKKNIYDYRPHGARHFLMKKKEVDSVLIREVLEKRNAELIAFFKQKKEARLEGDTTDWKQAQNELEQKWDDIERDYYKNKNEQVMESLWELMEIKIDDISYTDKVMYKLSTHYNNEERGFRCKINVDSLSQGEHILSFERKIFDLSYPDSLRHEKLHVPFYK